jgi:ABC-2 type transport system ATP-binding protein
VVATPYLDEAERCHRVALMYQGVLHQIGTPADLKQSIGSQRLELRTPDLAIAEQLLNGEARETVDIKDVQRFGDRLDVLVADSVVSQSAIETLFRSKGMAISDIQVGQPTLENTFVATLRALGEDTRSEAFPGDHDHGHLRGRIAIGATNLTKHFGSFTAVKDVNIHIKYGEVYGLLGANGAGKTTTIKMLCGLLAPTSGQMQLAGETGSLRSQAVRQQLGYMSQKFSLYDDLSIEENLAFFAGVYGVPDSERVARRHWALSFAGLEGKEKLVTGSLPGGWKQRVALGAAIMHEPSILFLDEPTSGVDPLARRAFWTVINRLADLGTAILVTTHYLEEAEQCNRIGFMVAGEVVAEGTPGEIKGRQEGTLLELSVDKPQLASDVLKQDLDRWRISLFGDRLHVISDDTPIRGIERTTSRLARHGIRVLSAREVPFSLEDVFIGVVEKARQQGLVALDN